MKPTQALRITLGLPLVAWQSAGFRATAQLLTLTGTNYSQNFDSIGAGLPTGWSVRTSASISSLGTVAPFFATNAPWKTVTAGLFANRRRHDRPVHITKLRHGE